MKVLKAEVKDLLESPTVNKPGAANGHAARIAVSGRPPIQIRET